MANIIINKHFEINKEFYELADFPLGTLEKIPQDVKVQTALAGKFQGRQYRVVTIESLKHSTPAMRYLLLVPELLAALTLTIFSLGLALFSSYVPNLWREVFSGRVEKKINLFVDGQKGQDINQVALDTVSMPGFFSTPIVSKTGLKSSSSQPFIQFFSKAANPEKIGKLPSILKFSPNKSSLLNQKVNFLEGLRDPKSPPDSKFAVVYLRSFLEAKEDIILEMTTLQSKDIPVLKDRFQKRIDLYNQAIDLEERICNIKKQPYFSSILMHDFEVPWEDSSLKIAFLTDSEVGDLTIHQMQWEMNERQLEVLAKRIFLITPKKIDYNAMTKARFLDLKLIYLHLLPQDILDQYIDEFSSVKMLSLLTPQQLEQIPIAKLSDEQFKYIYSDNNRVKNLKSPNLEECIEIFSRIMPDKLIEFSPQQIASLDFSDKGPIAKPILTEMAKSVNGQIISWMTKEQILVSLNRKLFSPDTAKYVIPAQIAEIDFTKVDCKKAGGLKVITALFQKDENVSKIKDKESLQHLLPFIHWKRLVHLNETQLKWIDFSDKEIIKDDLTAIANLKSIDTSIMGKIITWMTKEQIITCLNKRLFTPRTAIHVTPGQIGEIDFTKDLCRNAGGESVMTALFKKDENISKIKDKDSLHHLIPHIDPERLAHLTETQIKWLDFSDKGPINQAVFNGIIGKDQWNYISIVTEKMKSLELSQIRVGLKRKIFNKYVLHYIKDEILKQLTDKELKPFPELIEKKKKL